MKTRSQLLHEEYRSDSDLKQSCISCICSIASPTVQLAIESIHDDTLSQRQECMGQLA